MKLAFIFGTRPEIIKLSSLIRLCRKKKIDFFTVHTGQHYSHNMFKLFLKELELDKPDYTLDVKSKAPYRQGDHTGRMMVKLEHILLEEKPSVVLVQGDTNTTLAGALTASKISTTRSFTGFNMRLGHVEAGLRSYDRSMPEEINRVMSDHLSDFLFAPTSRSKEIAVGEGISKNKISVTGNTIVDAMYHGLESGKNKIDILSEYGLKKDSYILLTLHRQENVDNRKRLIKILAGVEKVGKKHKMPVVFPIHPRTVKMFRVFDIKPHECIRVVEPCSFLGFLQLESSARLILTDSGGVQEESCVLRVPCVTLRTTTERPEAVDIGANVIAGTDSRSIFDSAEIMLDKKRKWSNPFGNGNAAGKIIEKLKKSTRERP
ncbi:MAG: UDP-N-acetylglucosamine 2-epimerase (non-hydrolyzing) [Candidatus Omnitrophota bacterium]